MKSMKKLIVIISAVMLLLGCASLVSACGGCESIAGMSIVRFDGTDAGASLDLGSFVRGEGDGPPLSGYALRLNYSDGTYRELNFDEVDTRYSFNKKQVDGFPSSLPDYAAGEYSVSYFYEGTRADVYFKVVENYAATVIDKTVWKYGETGAEVSVEGVTGITVKYVLQSDYDAVKDAADLGKQLLKKAENYAADKLTPDTYYVFALYGENETFSKPEKVVVEKGDLTPVNENCLSAHEYTYDGLISGKISLSQIMILNERTGDSSTGAHAVNAKGDFVRGDFVWAQPDSRIDSNDSGKAYGVKFVCASGYYNDLLLDGGIEITVRRGGVALLYDGFTVRNVYSGQPQEYKYYPQAGCWLNLLDVTPHSDTTAVKGSDYITLATRSAQTGVYGFTLSLKDDVNYYWLTGDPENTGDVAPKEYVYEIIKMQSYLNLQYVDAENTPVYTHTPAIDGQNRLKALIFTTARMEGTLTATVLESYNFDPDYGDAVKRTTVRATAEISLEGDDEFVIFTVTEFSDPAGGVIIVRFTAEGKDGYDDVDWVTAINVLPYGEASAQ